MSAAYNILYIIMQKSRRYDIQGTLIDRSITSQTNERILCTNKQKITFITKWCIGLYY
jgi:hypothetical protein